MQSKQPMLEDYISGKRAVALMGISAATFKRYHRSGYRGIFLRTLKIGGRRVTTREWIKEFIERQNGSCGPSLSSAVNELEDARERLRAAGVLT